MQKRTSKIRVIDLFCGIGGITRGFVNQNFEVVAGIDNEGSCQFGYEKNNAGAKFIHKDIREVESKEIVELYGNDCEVKVLVGCAPCQPFSGMNTKKSDYFNDPQKANSRSPLDKFASLVEETLPTIVSMENVANLANKEKYPAFVHFLEVLEKNNYKVSYRIVDTSEYGIPQKRRRLVLLASRLGEIQLIESKNIAIKTVFETISHLPRLGIGETHPDDPYHRTQNMSDLNKKRIQVIPKNGGTLAKTPGAEDLVVACHKKDSGKTYSCSVYGRMKWNEPSPTLTTLCLGIGNGRYGHPEQDRAISLREAALIQTFPMDYQFTENPQSYCLQKVVRQIGNAVPVKLGEIIAESIRLHLNRYGFSS